MNRWYFWILAPIAVSGACVLFLTAEPRGVLGHVFFWIVVSILLLGTIGLSNPIRFRWALQGVVALVVIAGLSYFVSELVAWCNGKPLIGNGRRSSSSLVNAALFLFVFGWPAVRFLLSGWSGSAIDELVASDEVDEQSGNESQADD